MWSVFMVDDTNRPFGRFTVHLIRGDDYDGIVTVELPCREGTDCLLVAKTMVALINSS